MATLALALAAKYSAIALFVIVAIASFLADSRSMSAFRRAEQALTLAIDAFGLALLFTWILHGFAFMAMDVPGIGLMRLPTPIVGIYVQLHHQYVGAPAFFLGQRSVSGWWLYLPVALVMKSTPAELLVAGAAYLALVRHWRTSTRWGLVWRVALVTFSALIITNRLAIGVRYALILGPLSIGLAAERLFAPGITRRTQLLTAGALVALQLFSVVSIAPHYLSYFNAFAGGPERGYARLADSNIDWGQDLPALRAQFARLGVRHPLLSYFGTAPVGAYAIEADQWNGQGQLQPGRWDWVAISVTNLDGVYLPRDPFIAFRALTPSARAGYSILLYSTSREDVQRALAALSEGTKNTATR
jgi:hypothetical protein